MKKITVITFSLIVVTGLILASLAGIVIAQQEGYSTNHYEAITEPTMDGTWTNSFEWLDAEEKQLDGDVNAVFRSKYNAELITGDTIYHFILIEVLDTTDDAEDYVQICFAAADNPGGEPVGGANPQIDCTRFDFVGHDVSGFTFYRGDGSQWVESSDYTWGTDVLIVDSFGTSGLSSTPHLIVEVRISPRAFDINPEFWIRVAAYDESNSGAGVQAWPASSVNVPNEWGLVEFINETIPEFPSWIIVPLFVSATLAVIVVRKRIIKNEKLA